MRDKGTRLCHPLCRPRGLSGAEVQVLRLPRKWRTRALSAGSLLSGFPLSYCSGEPRDSPYSVASATVSKASRLSGARSPSLGEDAGPFPGGRMLAPRLGRACLALPRSAEAVAAGDLALAPVAAVAPYMGSTALKGLAAASDPARLPLPLPRRPQPTLPSLFPGDAAMAYPASQPPYNPAYMDPPKATR
ncbi:hypothetical protein D623_10011386 [Myotis brandtii]|uniref:Uncharacterized protein n=1 Tax=Myotis brandtii TaxID=109478 RepID=S7PGG3_MYOBR|nr:hypothetical protein D623_10011386 [Myotis brandtii]